MRNYSKTLLLMILLTILFVWVGSLLGGRQGAIIAFLIAAAMNFYGYWFSDKLVLRHYRAVEVGPSENSRLYRVVSSLASRSNLPMPKVYIIPSQTPNAFATGRNPQNAAVAATEGILNLLNDDELAGVMAHELTHVKNRDILIQTIAATFAGAITMLAQVARFSPNNPRSRRNPVILMLVIIGAPLAAMLIRTAISRKREFAADYGGAEISREPLALANALNKLHTGVQRFPMANSNPAHSHMFIVNPLFGNLQKLFATHPPTEERIQRLQDIATRIR